MPATPNSSNGSIVTLWWTLLAVFVVVSLVFAFFGSGKKAPVPQVSEIASNEWPTKEELETADSEAYSDAVNGADPNLCERIKGDAELRERCIDNSYAALAQRKSDVSLCSKISDSGVRGRCEDSFAYDSAIRSGKRSNCDKISEPELRVACVRNVVFAAIESWTGGDESSRLLACESLSGDDKDYCVRRVKSDADVSAMKDAMSKNDPKLCKEIANPALSSACSDSVNMSLAMKSKDSTPCKLVTDASKRSKCEAAVSVSADASKLSSIVSSGDSASCDAISTSQIRAKCRDSIAFKAAISATDLAGCSKLSDQNLKQRCVSAIEIKKSAGK